MSQNIEILGLIKNGKSRASEAKRLVNKYRGYGDDTTGLVTMAIRDAKDTFLKISLITIDNSIRNKIKEGTTIAESFACCYHKISLLDVILSKLYKNYDEISDLAMENIISEILASPDDSLEFNSELFNFMLSKKDLPIKDYIYKFRDLADKNSGGYWCFDILLMLTEKLDEEFIEYYLRKNSAIQNHFETVIEYICSHIYQDNSNRITKTEFAFEKMFLVYGKSRRCHCDKLTNSLHILLGKNISSLKLYQIIIQMGGDPNYRKHSAKKSSLDRVKENNFINYPFDSDDNIVDGIIPGAKQYFVLNDQVTYCDVNGQVLKKMSIVGMTKNKIDSFLDPKCKDPIFNVNVGGGCILHLG